MESNLDMFLLLNEACIYETVPLILKHLTSSYDKQSSYFPLLNTYQYDWVGDPFVETSSDFHLSLIKNCFEIMYFG